MDPKKEASLVVRDDEQNPTAIVLRDPKSRKNVLYRLEEMDIEEIGELIEKASRKLPTEPKKA